MLLDLPAGTAGHGAGLFGVVQDRENSLGKPFRRIRQLDDVTAAISQTFGADLGRNSRYARGKRLEQLDPHA